MKYPHQSDEALGAFFDKCALNGDMADFTPEEQRKLASFLRLWDIRAGQHVLEPGCGSGRLTARLASIAGSEGRVHACDLSPEMIRRAKQHGLPPQAEFVVESINTLHEPDKSFDHVVCLNVFPHFSHHPRALAQIARVLKPGGHLWISHFEGSDRINQFHRDAAPEVAQHMLPGAQAMRQLIAGAGLTWIGLTDIPEMYSLHAIKSTENTDNHGQARRSTENPESTDKHYGDIMPLLRRVTTPALMVPLVGSYHVRGGTGRCEASESQKLMGPIGPTLHRAHFAGADCSSK